MSLYKNCRGLHRHGAIIVASAGDPLHTRWGEPGLCHQFRPQTSRVAIRRRDTVVATG